MLDTPLGRLADAVDRLDFHTRSRPLSGIRHHDADDATGTLETDDARGFDPRHLLRTFARHGVTVVVIGQVAGILHGSTALTGDLDLLWDGTPDTADALAAAFADAGADLADDEGYPLACTGPVLADRDKVLFRTTHASGDCCTPRLRWGIDVDAFIDRAETATDGNGLNLRYLNRDDLIAMRRAAGRPKDSRRLDELVKLGRS